MDSCAYIVSADLSICGEDIKIDLWQSDEARFIEMVKITTS